MNRIEQELSKVYGDVEDLIQDIKHHEFQERVEKETLLYLKHLLMEKKRDIALLRQGIVPARDLPDEEGASLNQEV